MILSNELSCEADSFSHCHNPTGFNSQRFEALFPSAGTLGCSVCLAPQLFFLVITHKCGATWSFNCCLAVHPLCPSCPSLPILPVWMNVSSLTPWLSDFHTVCFSVISGYILFLNLLLSFFWLCEEAKYMYLCPHLGQKSTYFFSSSISFDSSS